MNKMDVVKVSWSGGKDSTASVILHHGRGDHCKIVCYIPHFTEEIPLIQKAHFEFIHSAAEKFRSWGHEVYIVKGLTYWDYVTHVSLKGKFKGKIFGFPTIKRGACGFKRDSKLKALKTCDVGFFDYEDIGIANDEPQRFSNLSESRRSILVEYGYSEKKALFLCDTHKLMSPIYTSNSRDGCVLCPFSKSIEREKWLQDYPDVRPLLVELQNIVKSERPDRAPLPNYQYFI